MKKLLLYLCMMMASFTAKAQDEPVYLMEVGGGAGLMGYLGDFNGSLTKDLQPMASLVGRYNLNVYMALKMNVSYGKLKGSSADVQTFYPKFDDNPYAFNNTLVDVGLTYEYNFWPYGTGRDYRGAQRLTPYILIGIGATYVKTDNAEKNSVFSANVPLGIGLKYKVGKRVNLGLEWAMHFSLSDELDGQKDPYDIQSTGMFKNTDCYSTLQCTLTYSFMAKCRTCHNEDE